VMLVAYIAYIVRAMRIGPERDHPDQAGQAGPTRGRVAVSGGIAPGPARGR
jgi:hypothetical protein